MIYPETNLKTWSQKYGLIPEKKVCACCGQELETTVPIIMKGYAGFETPEHGCDKKFNSAIFTPITDESKNAWSKIVSAS